MLTHSPELARYTCGFRTALEPSTVMARARSFTELDWTESNGPGLRLLGRQEDCLQLEIWEASNARSIEWEYGLSVACPATAEAAVAFFAWREKICEAFGARPIVTSVQEEISATHDAQRDILELDGQGLTELPSSIRILHQHLKVLSLSNNTLSSLPDELVQLQKLTELDVSDNRLTQLPAQIGRLTNLEILSAGRNRLCELPPSIGQLAGLRDLRVNDNKLRRLPREIGQLTKLRRLHIQQNRLAELPQQFTHLEALWEWQAKPNRLPPSGRDGLKAGENPWLHPPEEIVRSGPSAIRAFLEIHPRKGTEGVNAVYTVYADDNYHQHEEQWKRRALGSSPDCATALAICRKVVDDFFATFPCAPRTGLRGNDPAELMDVYRLYGEDPWICTDAPHCEFDAWSYAWQCCEEIARATRERPPSYTVCVHRNIDGHGPFFISEYSDGHTALAACRKIVDDFLLKQQLGTAEQLLASWLKLGEYPYILTGDEAFAFSAPNYAQQRCQEILSAREG